MGRIPVLCAVALGFGMVAYSQSANEVSLMPLPQKLSVGQGSLVVGKSFRVVVEAPAGDEVSRSASERLGKSLERAAGHAVAVTGTAGGKGELVVAVGKAATAQIGGNESYTLTIGPDGARLEAATSLGAVRGLATVRQLIAGHGAATALPSVTIADAPLYAWRGVMVDTARHFVPIDALERTLDAMELVKLNVLHLHLSDNEGFRVESKAFSRLQQMGSDGEFYTQAELKGLIRDAALRGIVIVPEFDMPSHAQSWFAGYPELSSSEGPFKPGELKIEGIGKDATLTEIMKVMTTAKTPAFDPSRETTYEFLDRFIGEMAELFPAPYFHIGADENNGAVWLANPSIVAFMKAHGIADAPALQAYFVSRVNELVAKHGRTMVAWEEAYAPESKAGGVYQVWSPLAKVDLLKTPLAAKDRLLVSKGFYLDLFYPAYVHYANDALPAEEGSGKALMGGEGALWTEMADRDNVEARMWPRQGAIAERLWTEGRAAEPDALYARLFRLSAVLDREGVHNLEDYRRGVERLAAGGDVEAVRTLLDVLTPIKGYKRLMSSALHARMEGETLKLDQVADVALVDSEAKYRFRAAVKSFLVKRDAVSEAEIRKTLETWVANDARFAAASAKLEKLEAVKGHSARLAELAKFTSGVMVKLEKGKRLEGAELARADELLKAAQAVDGQVELGVTPEFASLLHGELTPEPTAYPLF